MKTAAEKSGDLLNLMVDWQAKETEIIEYATKELQEAKNPLTKTILKVLKLEAEKHCAIQQMIIESEEKEAIHLSPEELSHLSSHINKYLEAEEEAIISRAEKQATSNQMFIPRYLLTYLISDMKKQNALLRQLDDELKTASIPTSVTAKKFGSA